MLKRLCLLFGVLAIPVGVALGSQYLAHTVEPPELPEQPVITGEDVGDD